MPDLKTFWDNPGMPKSYDTPQGDSVTSSGTDPLITVDAPNGLEVIWNDPVPDLNAAAESPNSVSGLPPQPNRFEPPETPPGPPSLQDRRPGTIDER